MKKVENIWKLVKIHGCTFQIEKWIRWDIKFKTSTKTTIV